jgi:hypothetical protein
VTAEANLHLDAHLLRVGGESLITGGDDPAPVPITELVPEEHLPLIMEHIALHRQRESAVSEAGQGLGLTPQQLALLPAYMRAELEHQMAQVADQHEPCLPAGWEEVELSQVHDTSHSSSPRPKAWPCNWHTQLAFIALGESDRWWAQPHARHCLME